MSVVVNMDQATVLHAELLAPNMRKEDAAEVLASGGYSPLGALEDAILMSGPNAWAVFFDGELACIWGVAPFGLMSGTAIPWLLTGTAVDRHPKTFFKLCKRAIAHLRQQYLFLFVMVDARYERALRWAARLGFQVGTPEPFGVRGLPFCRISLKGDQDV